MGELNDEDLHIYEKASDDISAKDKKKESDAKEDKK
jgi:hypothetical protein